MNEALKLYVENYSEFAWILEDFEIELASKILIGWKDTLRKYEIYQDPSTTSGTTTKTTHPVLRRTSANRRRIYQQGSQDLSGVG